MDLRLFSVFSRLKASLSTSSTVAGGYGGGSGLLICEHSHLDDDFRFDGTKAEVESVLSKIDKINDLAEVDMDEGNGCSSCLGLLDPVTNIHLNFLIGCLELPPADDGGVRAGDEEPMSHRSLDGLITFLTCLFPYLPEAEALTYIDAAAADPLVAALLVIHRRELTIDSFSTARSLEIALRSAAVAAEHPNPDCFVHGWKVASLIPQMLATQLRGHNKDLIATVGIFLNRHRCASSNDRLQPEDFWELAKSRLIHVTDRALLKGGGRLPSARGYMKRMLLSVIHGYYLKALAILPKEDLTECYHRSLLIGGHCYGPLDPVSNIIANTIWYEQSFPPVIQVQLKTMISTDCLWRIAARSLYGLVSFLCNRNRNLTPDQALHHLLVARANLKDADPLQLRDDDGIRKKIRSSRGATVRAAYVAAGQSAKHPRPDLQAEFLGEPNSVRNLHTFKDTLLPAVCDGCTLDKKCFDRVIRLFRSPSSVGMAYSQHEPRDPEPIRKEAYQRTCAAKHGFFRKDERVRRKVEATLHKFNKPGEPKYTLHLICGVNEFVRREFSTDPEVKAYNPHSPYKYHYSHINFLATREGSLAPKPELFFAECNNHGTDTSWCVPIPLHPDGGIFLEDRPDVGMRPEAARCIYCEHKLGRIWHPITKLFYGCDHFENFDGNYFSNDDIVSNGFKTDWVHGVADDAIYSNVCDSGRRGPTIVNGIVSWL